MYRLTLCCFFVITLSVVGCTQTDDSCDDLKGTITHTTTEITGINSATAFNRISTSGATAVVDQVNGTEFSNLIIELDLSWIEEVHRFRETNTFNTSLLDWFISPASACSLAPFYDDYQPAVTGIQIFSDSDFNALYTTGTDLTPLFSATGLMGDSTSISKANINGTLLSSRAYLLEPAWVDGELVAIPSTPQQHIFTIMITLTDGQAFEIRTPEVLISGI